MKNSKIHCTLLAHKQLVDTQSATTVGRFTMSTTTTTKNYVDVQYQLYCTANTKPFSFKCMNVFW